MNEQEKEIKTQCRLCGKNIMAVNGWLQRVNEKGVPGIWECRPSCDTNITKEDALIQVITGEN